MSIMSTDIVNIALIEVNYHYAALRELCLLLNSPEFSVTVYTTPIIWARVGLSDEELVGFTIVQKNESISMAQYFADSISSINQADIVLFNTLAIYHKLVCKLAFTPPILLRVHNSMADLAPSKGVTLKDKKILSTLAGLFRRVVVCGDWKYKKKFLSKVAYVVFPGEGIFESVKELGLLKGTPALTPCLPLGFLKKVSRERAPSSTINLVVTGCIDNRRRNYSQLFDALKLAIPLCEHPIALTFLGAPKAKAEEALIRKLHQLGSVSDNFTFNSYASFVDAEEYLRVLLSADLMIAPLKVNTRYQFYNEVYGQTKASGAEADVISYQLPCLFPRGYRLTGGLGKCCESYHDTEDLANKIIIFTNDPNSKLRQVDFTSVTEFDADYIRRTFQKQCLSIIEQAAPLT